LIVVGASAAGLMTAITARAKDLRILILDGQKKCGAKILMSGGTRCNVTNQHVTEADYESEQPRFVRNVLAAFPSHKAIAFFEDLGVKLILEPGGKYFPTTHSGKTVLDALLKKLSVENIPLALERKVKTITFHNGLFHVKGEGFSYQAKTVCLSTGGLSYPSTGSDGVGYALAKTFGHTLIPTMPSLTPFTTNDTLWKSISGVALPARLTLKVDGKKQKEFEGDFLFTHVGFSGPVCLNMSRFWLKKKDSAQIVMNFLPSFDESQLKERIEYYVKNFPKRLVKSFLQEHLPERFVEVFLRKVHLVEMVLSQLKQEQKKNLMMNLLAYPLEVANVVGYSKAEATAGGVDLKELDYQTMESKHQPGLFFSGEIVDVDGRIGGFNFQWAWSSGYVAGCGIWERIEQK
jgi:predicted Rossmann fold flavoprotein